MRIQSVHSIDVHSNGVRVCGFELINLVNKYTHTVHRNITIDRQLFQKLVLTESGPQTPLRPIKLTVNLFCIQLLSW